MQMQTFQEVVLVGEKFLYFMRDETARKMPLVILTNFINIQRTFKKLCCYIFWVFAQLISIKYREKCTSYKKQTF